MPDSTTLPPLDPDYEAQRQRALERYEILDTDPEFAFDDLVRLASLVCQTPISLITLIDQDRQWFKARIGIDQTQTSRDISFCNHAVVAKAPLEVRDATRDPRFADNPMVTGDPGVRFYAGVPLRTHDDFCLGTIYVVDTVPRELTDAQRQALNTIAEQVMAQLELKLRNRQLESGYDRLTRANRRLDQFTAMVSHDLKTPLAGLLSLADLMLGDARRGDADAVCEALTVMNGEVARMQRLVTGLLEFARATRPTDIMETVDVAALLNEIVRTLPGASSFRFSFSPVLPVIRTARVPLRQVLYNLLQNAIKYHPAGQGHISVMVEPGAGSQLTFRVHDDGAGIPAHAHERIFQLFQRLHGPAGPEGSGVGLATVRHLVEDHGGTIRVESEPGQGTTFIFTWEEAPDAA